MSPLTAVAHARTFTSVRRYRNYRLWFFAQLISVCGTWVQNVAQAWLVVLLTHDPVAVGGLALCQFGPYMLFGLVGGAVADRIDNRVALFITQASQAVFAGVLALLAVLNAVTLPEVYVLAALTGLTQVLDNPARQAFTIQLVGRADLPNAIALNSSIFNASRVVGPAIGGLLIGTVGMALCFFINAVSFGAVLVALLLMQADDLFPVTRARRQRIVSGIREGVAYAWRTPPVLLVLAVVLVISTVGINFNVLLPVLTDDTLQAGAVAFGILSAAFGLGALTGALIAASRGRASWPLLLGGGLVFTLAETLLAPLHTIVAAAAMLVICGVGFTIFAANANATLQLETPDELRGRVLSLYGYVFFGTAPLGGLLAGWLSRRQTHLPLGISGGTTLAFAVCGGVSLVAAVVGAIMAVRHGFIERRPVSGAVRRLRRREDHPAPAREHARP